MNAATFWGAWRRVDDAAVADVPPADQRDGATESRHERAAALVAYTGDVVAGALVGEADVIAEALRALAAGRLSQPHAAWMMEWLFVRDAARARVAAERAVAMFRCAPARDAALLATARAWARACSLVCVDGGDDVRVEDGARDALLDTFAVPIEDWIGNL